MSNLHLNKKCKRCGLGIDDDGDGDCGICAGLTYEDIKIIRNTIEALKSRNISYNDLKILSSNTLKRQHKGENGRRI